MAETVSGNTDSANTGPDKRRHISPWLLILGAGLLAVLIFGGFAALTVAFNKHEPAPLGIQSVTMPDGRLLVLEAVTYGTNHEFEIETRSRGFSLFPVVRSRPISESTSSDQLMLWFSCRDARTLRYRDFDWWTRCAAVNQHGEEIDDENAGLDGYGNTGSSSSTSGTRPLSIGRTSGLPLDYMIAHSSLPRMRHDGTTFKLRVYGMNDDVVAEFEVPDPSLAITGPPPTWTPDPYPASATIDDLTVTLKGLTSRVNVWQENGRDREYVTIDPQVEVSRNGQVTQDWYPRDISFLDALGNESAQYSFSLSPHEAAWKVKMQLFRQPTAAFAPHEMWTTTLIETPENDRAEFLNQSHTLGSVNVEVTALGGSGTVKYTSLNASHGNASYSGSAGEKQFEIDTDWTYSSRGSGGSGTTSVTCDLPHVAVKISGNSTSDDVRMLASDDHEQEIKVHGPYVSANVHFWFLEPLEDTSAVAFKFIVQQGKSVEFIVAPPEIKHPPRRVEATEVVERLAAVSRFPLSFSSARQGNYQILLAQPEGAVPELIRLTQSDNMCLGGAWSPDGTQIAFESQRDGNYDLFVMNADGTGMRQLTSTPAAEHAPAWSPDGQRLCFRRDTGDPALNWELFVMNIDGTGETNITNNPANDADPAWSPDGERIAFTSGRAEGRWCLYTMNPDGTDVTLISKTSNGYVYPAWSPDGQRIAFTGSVDNHYEIYVIDPDGQNEHRLTQLAGLSMFAAWSPDGKLIAFLHRSDDMPWGRASLYVMQADGSGLSEIAPVECTTEGGRPAWKPQPPDPVTP